MAVNDSFWNDPSHLSLLWSAEIMRRRGVGEGDRGDGGGTLIGGSDVKHQCYSQFKNVPTNTPTPDWGTTGQL